MLQVHQQEREIVHGVGRRQRLVEFQTIEQHRPAIEQDDIAKMQIAVAMADPTRAPARLEQLSPAGELGAAAQRQALALSGRQRPPGNPARSSALPSITACIPACPPSRRAAPPVRETRRSPLPGRPRPGGQLAAPGEAVEPRRLIEPGHFEQPLDRRAIAGELQPAVRFTGDRHEPAIEHRGGPPIQLELGLERSGPRLERPEIQEAVVHGALHLVGALTGQKHQGRMSGDSLDLGPGLAIAPPSLRKATTSAWGSGADHPVGLP